VCTNKTTLNIRFNFFFFSIDQSAYEDAGVYSVVISNKLGELKTSSIVKIQPKASKPVFIKDLIDTNVIEGYPLRLDVKYLGYPEPTLKWTIEGKEIEFAGQPKSAHYKITQKGDGNASLIIDNVSKDDAGRYELIATNDQGSTATVAKVNVSPIVNDQALEEPPMFAGTLHEITGDEGKELQFTLPFSGNPIPECLWSKNGKPIEPSDRIMLTCDGKRVGIILNPAEVSDTGMYQCLLANPLGETEARTEVHVRKIFQKPNFVTRLVNKTKYKIFILIGATFISRLQDVQVVPTYDAKFPARVIGVPKPEISWSFNEKPIQSNDKYNMKFDGDTVCLYIRNCGPEDDGLYSCTAKNKEGQDTCDARLEIVERAR
jgi:hypothetical protein